VARAAASPDYVVISVFPKFDFSQEIEKPRNADQKIIIATLA